MRSEAFALVVLALLPLGCSGSSSADAGLICGGDPNASCESTRNSNSSLFCATTWSQAQLGTCKPNVTIGVCHGLGLVSQSYGDGVDHHFYDLDSGALVATVGLTAPDKSSCEGPASFVPPDTSACSLQPLGCPDGGDAGF